MTSAAAECECWGARDRLEATCKCLQLPWRTVSRQEPSEPQGWSRATNAGTASAGSEPATSRCCPPGPANSVGPLSSAQYDARSPPSFSTICLRPIITLLERSLKPGQRLALVHPDPVPPQVAVAEIRRRVRQPLRRRQPVPLHCLRVRLRATEPVLVAGAQVVLPVRIARQRTARVPAVRLLRAVPEPTEPLAVHVPQPARRRAVAAIRRLRSGAQTPAPAPPSSGTAALRSLMLTSRFVARTSRIRLIGVTTLPG